MSNDEKTKMTEISDQLQKPFDECDIEWRVQSCGVSQKGKPWAIVIPYITNRAVQKRLDEVFGVMGWEDEFKETANGQGFLCGITAYFGNKKVTKWDGADRTNIESLKGGLSGSQKRAAVKFGIGRYLYQLEQEFAICSVVDSRFSAENYAQCKSTKTHISWVKPILPLWAIPFEDYSSFINPIKESKTLKDLQENHALAWKASETSNKPELKKQATYEKDQRKAFIIKNESAINKKRLEKMHLDMDQDILTFKELPTKSTVENYFRQVELNWSNRVKELDFETKELFEKLRNACALRVSEL